MTKPAIKLNKDYYCDYYTEIALKHLIQSNWSYFLTNRRLINAKTPPVPVPRGCPLRPWYPNSSHKRRVAHNFRGMVSNIVKIADYKAKRANRKATAKGE